ncbi:MAG: hypothetical protein NVS4B12_15720 [Ktedonobacteraceae bacterium]
MSGYYSGWRAQHYNMRWRTFTERTLAETLTMIDEAVLQMQTRLLRAPRVLDVGCGTGTLLKQLAKRLPEAELYGVDASVDMLTQARIALKEFPHVQLAHAGVHPGETAGLPYPSKTFDMITCTNVLHDLPEPDITLAGLRRLLAPEGQLVLEDYARREPPFPWAIVEWMARRIEVGHVQAYTLAEAHSLCGQAGLCVLCSRSFTVNWLWHGWVLRTSQAS